MNITQPHGNIIQPVFKNFNVETDDIVGYVMGLVAFDAYLINLLPDGVRGIYVVLETTCDTKITYELDGHIVSK